MHFVMPPPLAKATAASHQTPNTQDKIVHQVFITTTSLSLQTTDRSHHANPPL
jgi:hypothetical protein